MFSGLLWGAIVLTLCLPVPAYAQTDSVRTRFVPDPLSLYTPSGGFGIGGSIETVNLFRPGSKLALRGYISQHRGSYSATFTPRDLLSEGLTSGVDARYETHGRLRYHGVGPTTRENTRLFLDADVLEAGGYAGYRQDALGATGTLHLRTGQISGFKNDTDDAFDRLDEPSAFAIARDSGRVVTGVIAGGTLYFDARDTPLRPTRGVLLAAGADVFGGEPAALYQPYASASAHVPLGTATVAFRALAVVTRSFDAGEAVPIMLMPGFDARFVPGYSTGRLIGRDLVMADVRIEHPVQLLLDERLTGRIATDLFVMLAALNVYEDVFADLRGVPTWKKRFDPGENHGLRMSVGLGMNAYDPETQKPIYTAALGYSAEGWTLSTLTFNLDPRKLRSLWRW